MDEELFSSQHIQKNVIGNGRRVSTASFSPEKFTKQFTHSGWNYSKRRAIVVVDNNAMKDTKFKVRKLGAVAKSRNASTPRLFENGQEQDIYRTQQIKGQEESKTLSISTRKQNQKKEEFIIESSRMSTTRNDKQAEHLYRKKLITDALTNTREACWDNVTKILHPKLGNEYNKTDHRIPGMKNLNDIIHDTSSFRKRRIRQNDPYCRYEEFKKMVVINTDTPTIRTSCPYLVQEEMERKTKKESKKKWLSEKGFVNNCGPKCLSYKIIKNYEFGTEPIDLKALHAFRDTDKSKWIGKTFKY